MHVRLQNRSAQYALLTLKSVLILSAITSVVYVVCWLIALWFGYSHDLLTMFNHRISAEDGVSEFFGYGSAKFISLLLGAVSAITYFLSRSLYIDQLFPRKP